MKTRRLPLVVWGVVLFCAFGCRDLLWAWGQSPFDRFGWLSFLFWAGPLLVVLGRRQGEGYRGRAGLLGASLGCSLLGILGGLNVLQHVGLALCLGGLLPWRWQYGIWLIFAVSWMPALGWLLGKYMDVDHVVFVRLIVALTSSMWIILPRCVSWWPAAPPAAVEGGVSGAES